jgi:hypothetical protein
MPSLILLPFSVFFVCCILQFWYLKKVRDALIDHHPETFLQVEKSSIFPMQGIWRFARGKQYKKLGDAELNRHVRNLKRLMIVAIVAWVGFAVSIFSTDLEPPRLSLSVANGSYSNSCCGIMNIRVGYVSTSSQKFSYVVERDKRPYIITKFYVGASPKGFTSNSAKFPLKMYLDDDTHPTNIEVMDGDDGSVFLFRRLSDK